jgi:hypothetical protein
MAAKKYKHNLHIILRFRTNPEPGNTLVAIKKGVQLDMHSIEIMLTGKKVGVWETAENHFLFRS